MSRLSIKKDEEETDPIDEDISVLVERTLMQKVESGRQYINNRASKVPSRDTTLCSSFKASTTHGGSNNVWISEEPVLLATHAYFRTFLGVARLIIPKTLTVWEVSTTITAISSIQTPRFWGNLHPRSLMRANLGDSLVVVMTNRFLRQTRAISLANSTARK